MLRKSETIFFLIIFMISFSGCATTRKDSALENQGLRNQVSLLEAQVQSRDEEITSLREAMDRAGQENSARKAFTEVKSRPNTKQVQTALKNAGFDPGTIDGKSGKQTVEAIKSFQRANNLSVDGKVGKKTWAALKEYLKKKVK